MTEKCKTCGGTGWISGDLMGVDFEIACPDCEAGRAKLTAATLDEWAETNSYTNEYGTKCYGPFVCHIMNLFDKRVHKDTYRCEWVAPYGFVPEAGCPVHD